MSKKTYINLLEYAKGLYGKALNLLEPGECDDFSVISGSIILIVGLEKLTKSVIYKVNPLMILLEKIEFKTLVEFRQGEDFNNRNTISFENALLRATELYPNLNAHKQDIKSIINDRNILMHNFGYLDIGNLEKKVQIKVADFTESICRECFESEPSEILGQETWSKLKNNRDAYKQAEVLELNTRIKHLKRLLAQGETLPCDPIHISEDTPQAPMCCPVCEENEALVYFDIDWDIDIDHREGVVFGAYPIPIPTKLKCTCGFTLQEHEEVDCLLEDQNSKIYDEILQMYLGDDYD
ncbi:MAG: hypothetical protein GVY04_23055 [Cyanobacteria bacterium]|jgi:hypothetical protein|nr:hypothetical protein [Cyanobacteria bacterium GSL.Bin1]